MIKKFLVGSAIALAATASHAKYEYCYAFGFFAHRIAEMRDAGVPEYKTAKDIITDRDLKPDTKRFMLSIVRIVYDFPHVSPDEIGKIHFETCLEKNGGKRL